MKEIFINSDLTSTRNVLEAEHGQRDEQKLNIKLLGEITVHKSKSLYEIRHPNIFFFAYFSFPVLQLRVLVSHSPCLSILLPFPSPGHAFPQGCYIFNRYF